jgi:hypothetical protein
MFPSVHQHQTGYILQTGFTIDQYGNKISTQRMIPATKTTQVYQAPVQQILKPHYQPPPPFKYTPKQSIHYPRRPRGTPVSYHLRNMIADFKRDALAPDALWNYHGDLPSPFIDECVNHITQCIDYYQNIPRKYFEFIQYIPHSYKLRIQHVQAFQSFF